MEVSTQSYLPWKISITILHLIASASACLRVDYRRRTRRLWWDDYAALIPAVTECLNSVALWIRLRHFSDNEDTTLREMKVRLSIINSGLFATTIWWSRISMALAVVRITPVWSRSRVITLVATCAFILNWIALVAFFTIICTVRTKWQFTRADVLVCGPAYMGAAASIATDIVGDVYLAVLPLYRLWRLRLPNAQRRLVRLVFSTSLLTLFMALVVLITSYGNVLKGPGAGLVWVMSLQIEEAISVIANNLTVLIAWGYKTFRGDVDMDAESDEFVIPHTWAASSSNALPSTTRNNALISTSNCCTSCEANCNASQINSLSKSVYSENPKLHYNARQQQSMSSHEEAGV